MMVGTNLEPPAYPHETKGCYGYLLRPGCVPQNVGAERLDGAAFARPKGT